jgi:hypothetical protein
MSLKAGRARVLLVVSAVVLLSGCWPPPSASVRPGGEPRIIGGGIQVEWVVDSARVESVDRSARSLALSVQGRPLAACNIGRGVQDWGDIDAGDQVSATIRSVLTVSVGPAEESDVRSGSPDAHVLVVEPSYRLLTVQFSNGGTETFKIGLHTSMKGFEPGDTVTIRPVEAVQLRVRRHARRDARQKEISRSIVNATSAD